MKKLYMIAAGLCLTFPAWADSALEPLINKVTLSLSAEQWVTSKSAMVQVGVNAAVSGQGIEKIQTEVMQKLNQIAASDWHLVSFNRQQDKSGLESIQINAQARLAQTELSGLRDKAKAISRPGETFTIDDIQFTPSEEETRVANINLRNNIYQQARAEIDVVNKMYPEQKYYLHDIRFLPSPIEPMPTAANAMMRMAAVPSLSVGEKQQLRAVVVLAAMPDVVMQKVAQH
jgi:hypothetical protein